VDIVKVRGDRVPRPVMSWYQTGIDHRIIKLLEKKGWYEPLVIQAQALPIIMSGRDCMGIAKTGSGKTLAFVLPLLRHVINQPSLRDTNNIIAMVIAPTRELVDQIGTTIRPLAQIVGLKVSCVYGGASMSAQICELKRGTNISVCTAGRLIDLVINCKVTSLKGLSFVVVDEADRMLDLGFEHQLKKIVHKIRPDRQTVFFSATLPRAVERMAYSFLKDPVEIVVGGKSRVNEIIEQTIVLISKDGQDRFLLLLLLLRDWSIEAKVLIFVNSQRQCDTLYKELIKCCYPCLSLHGGQDQNDRESTIEDFKSGTSNIMVATSVAARGLDVNDLKLVVNFEVPNHYEDYIHRIGRTGRAGNRGTSVTFLDPTSETIFAFNLVLALTDSEQPVSEELLKISTYEKKKREKTQSFSTKQGSGYGGIGYRFSAIEDKTAKNIKRNQAYSLGYKDINEDDKKQKYQDPNEIETSSIPSSSCIRKIHSTKTGKIECLKNQFSSQSTANSTIEHQKSTMFDLASVLATQLTNRLSSHTPGADISHIHSNCVIPEKTFYRTEFPINDFTISIRRLLTNKETQIDVMEKTGVSIFAKGNYFHTHEFIPEGAKKLHLVLEASTETALHKAKTLIKEIIEK
jgi:ATP-dependent RNA helicase DDX46/PRP5